MNNIKSGIEFIRDVQKSKKDYEKMLLDHPNNPQIKEGITKVAWVDINDISKKLENTYGNIKEILIVE